MEKCIEEALLPYRPLPMGHHLPLPSKGAFDLLDDRGDTCIERCSYQEMNVVLHYHVSEKLKPQLGFVVPQRMEEEATGLWVPEEGSFRIDIEGDEKGLLRARHDGHVTHVSLSLKHSFCPNFEWL